MAQNPRRLRYRSVAPVAARPKLVRDRRRSPNATNPDPRGNRGGPLAVSHVHRLRRAGCSACERVSMWGIVRSGGVALVRWLPGGASVDVLADLGGSSTGRGTSSSATLGGRPSRPSS
jgi:hypothetical protein